MKTKKSFIKFIRSWGIVFLMGAGIAFVCIDAISAYHDFDLRADRIRSAYIDSRKQAIKQEVVQVADMTRQHKSEVDKLTRKKIRSRVYEADAIARHIYQQNQYTETKTKIQKMVLDALRPIRFEDGIGYYFATRFDGVEMLFADRPRMEGRNLLDIQDTRGQYVIRDMIAIAKQSGEGFYEYHWTKPGFKKGDFKKISFIKRFEPWDWCIGTGLYVGDIEDQIKAELLLDISKIRFGKEGYIFVNRLNGDALVSNGERYAGDKKLWEVFNDNPGQMKDIFDKEYQAALKPQGDYIQYDHIKLSNPEKKSRKISFIFGLPELDWLVGAGVYLDDVERDIARMQEDLSRQIKRKILYFVLAVVCVGGLFYLFFSRLSSRLKGDIDLVVSFFKKAALSDEKIDRTDIRFTEFDQIAKIANKMLSDRIMAENALREREEKYRLLVENQTDVIVKLDTNGRFLFVSDSYCNMFGKSSAELLGSSYESLVHPDDREEAKTAMESLFFPPHTAYVEQRNMTEKGWRWLGWLGTSVMDDKGRVESLLGVGRDITEKKQMEEAIVNSEQKWRNVLVNTPQIGVSLDPEGKIIFVNQYFLTMTGWTQEEIIGGNWFELFVPEDIRDEIKKVFTRIINKEEPALSAYENDIVTKNGDRHHISWANVLSKDMHGDILDVTCLGIDLTERQKAEEENRKLQNQLFQSQKMEAVGRLAGGVAHDFNNMLTIISGNTEMILEDIHPENPMTAKLQEIKKAAERSANLTRQLLGFARRQTIAPKVLDLNETIEKMLKMLQRLIGEHIDLVWTPETGLWPIRMDPSQVDQILANLFVNARDSIVNLGQVTIETENAVFDDDYCAEHRGFKPGEYVMVAVSDNGIGMDKETLNNVFEPFFTTKEVGKGTGLGLATVYGIVKQNHGFINVYSETGQGTTFKIYFPRYAAAERQPAKMMMPDKSVGGSETVLLVEDEEDILRMTTIMLERLGYTVLPANSPDEAIQIGKSHPGEIHLLMTDVVMPQMSGREVAEKMTASYPGIKCLYMSGYTADVVAHHGILDEGVYFLNKPFSMQTLAAKIREILDGTEEKRS